MMRRGLHFAVLAFLIFSAAACTQIRQIQTRLSASALVTQPSLQAGPPLASISSIGTGMFHSCAVTQLGTVKCWGRSQDGQLGVPSSTIPSLALEVPGVTGAVSVTGGAQFGCALDTVGGVKCWGTNYYGQMGPNVADFTISPAVDIPGLSGVKALAAGYGHVCALTAQDTVKCWGLGLSGQLGNGTMLSSKLPVDVSGLSGVIQISAGFHRVCALLNTGMVSCWGYATDTAPSAIPVNSSVPGVVAGISAAVSVGSGQMHDCAVLASGSVKCWGSNSRYQLGSSDPNLITSTPVTVPGITDAVKVVGGVSHSCALTRSGAVKCWGDNTSGQLGTGNQPSSYLPMIIAGLAASAISASHMHTCARTQLNTVQCWGSNRFGELGVGSAVFNSWVPLPLAGISNASSLAARGTQSCVVTNLGGVKCWGDNSFGQLGNGSVRASSAPTDVVGLSGVRNISVSAYHTCAVTNQDRLKCWGNNAYGELGTGLDPSIQVYSPVDVLSGVSSVALSDYHSCAIMTDGSVKCWGYNVSGELGIGTQDSSNVPVNVPGVSGAIGLIVDDHYTCAVLSQGAAKCWGRFAAGSLVGNGFVGNYLSPTDVNLTGIRSLVPGGESRILAFTNLRGGAQCWGNCLTLGQSSLTPIDLDFVAIYAKLAGSSQRTCGITAAGALQCWGNNFTGTLGNNSTVDSETPVGVTGLGSGVAGVALGYTHSCALTTQGTVLCWGDNDLGQLGIGSPTFSDVPANVANGT